VECIAAAHASDAISDNCCRQIERGLLSAAAALKKFDAARSVHRANYKGTREFWVEGGSEKNIFGGGSDE